MTVTDCASEPAEAMTTTKSAVATSPASSSARPARSPSQACRVVPCESPGEPSALNDSEVKNVAPCQVWRAMSCTIRALSRSRAMILTERGFEFGY